MAAVALPRTTVSARRPSVAAAASTPCLLLGHRPYVASSASHFAAGRAAVAHPAARLCLRTRRHLLGAIADRYPIVQVSIEPKDEEDADKMANGLTKLAQEIPPLQFSRDDMTIIKGTGELDLDIIVERLKKEFKVEVNVGYPQVVYREIISKIVEARHVYKLSGKFPRYADVTLRIEPMEIGSGYEFKSEIKGGTMPKEYIADVMKGIEYTLPTGILAECPVVDLRVVLVDGSYRDGHVRPFKIAARFALLKGLQEAAPRLMEPVMRVQVITPGEHLDDVIYSLTYAREVKGYEQKPGGLQVVEALVPLASMFDYAYTLNRLSKGRASYTMQFAKFVAIPENIQDQVSRERREWASRLRAPQPRLSVAIADNYPIVRVAIEPKDKADADKMANGLTKLAQEIPSIQFSRGDETTFIKGTGELHLDLIVERLKREFEVEVNVGYPQVVYREIISKIAEAQYIYKHGGKRPAYADVTLRIEPMERGSGYEFKSEIKGGAMPKEYIQDVMKGIEDILPTGILAECPVVDLRVVLVDGCYRDSHERPFKIAAMTALLQGLQEASPRLAEPVMRVEVITPGEHLNDVASSLNARGELKSYQEKPGGLQVIEALVPLASMLDFDYVLNILSKGRALYTMQLAKFVFVPQHIQDRISRERL